LQSAPIKTLQIDQSQPEGAVREFRPRLSAAHIVKKVTVKGWHPEKKELITGEATIKNSPLGEEHVVTGAGKLAAHETFTVDHPIWSKEEADTLAHARLQDTSLTYITGEAVCTGDPKLDIGKIVKIIANADSDSDNRSDPFNGKYFIMGVTHQHIVSKTKDGGFLTTLRLARNAQKGS
jgi:hypothetical protein